jgi:hypothetical protein
VKDNPVVFPVQIFGMRVNFHVACRFDQRPGTGFLFFISNFCPPLAHRSLFPGEEGSSGAAPLYRQLIRLLFVFYNVCYNPLQWTLHLRY